MSEKDTEGDACSDGEGNELRLPSPAADAREADNGVTSEELGAACSPAGAGNFSWTEAVRVQIMSGERSGLVAAVEQSTRGSLKSEFVVHEVASEKVRPSGRLSLACSGLENGMRGFRFEKLLGEGHFGDVFHVEHTDSHGHYALKTLKEVRFVEVIAQYCCY